jgi:hypothetical protein
LNFYSSEFAPYPLSQGDLLYPVYFTRFEIEKVNLYDETSELFVAADFSKDHTVAASILAAATRHWGIVVTQSCDLDRANSVIVARVEEAQNLHADLIKTSAKDRAKAIGDRFSSAGKSPKHFYLPAHDAAGLTKSVAYLSDVQTYKATDLPVLSRLRKLSLSPDALTMLQEKLAYCFCRFGAPEHLCYDEDEWTEVKAKLKDKPPEPGEYPPRAVFADTKNRANKSLIDKLLRR